MRSAVIALLAAAFVGSAFFAASLDRFPGDLAASLWIQTLSLPWFQPVAAAISIEKHGLLIISVMVITVIGLYLLGWRRESYFLLASTVSGAIAVEITKALIARPRPSSDLVLVFQDAGSYSYPSGNAAVFGLFLIALAFAVAGRTANREVVVATWAAVAFLFLVIGLSRIFLGAHWLSDVIAGYLLGLVWVLLVMEIMKRFGPFSGRKPVRTRPGFRPGIRWKLSRNRLFVASRPMINFAPCAA